MKLKKILPVFLASLSCSPSISAYEDKSNSESSGTSSINAINPIISGLVGLGTGAAIAGLSVRSVKNKEVEEEKGKVKTLGNEKNTLQSENDSLKQENNSLKEQIKKINTLVGLAEDANHDVLINKLKSFSSNDLSKAKSMWDKIKSTTLKYDRLGIKNLTIIDDLMHFENFNDVCLGKYYEEQRKICYTFLKALVSLNEYLFEDTKSDSVKILENYDQSDPDKECNPEAKLRPNILKWN